MDQRDNDKEERPRRGKLKEQEEETDAEDTNVLEQDDSLHLPKKKRHSRRKSHHDHSSKSLRKEENDDNRKRSHHHKHRHRHHSKHHHQHRPSRDEDSTRQNQRASLPRRSEAPPAPFIPATEGDARKVSEKETKSRHRNKPADEKVITKMSHSSPRVDNRLDKKLHSGDWRLAPSTRPPDAPNLTLPDVDEEQDSIPTLTSEEQGTLDSSLPNTSPADNTTRSSTDDAEEVNIENVLEQTSDDYVGAMAVGRNSGRTSYRLPPGYHEFGEQHEDMASYSPSQTTPWPDPTPPPPPEVDPIEAMLVEDNEADVEAQVQDRVRNIMSNIVTVEAHVDDRDASAQQSSNKRKRRLLGAGVILILVVVAVAVALGVVLPQRSSNSSPPQETAPPSPQESAPPSEVMEATTAPEPDAARFELLRQEFEKEVDGTPFDDDSTPQYKALQWLTVDDSLQLSPEATSPRMLLERYIVALLYFSTNGGGWTNNYGFLGNSSVCLWNVGRTSGERQGIFCDDEDNDGTDVSHIVLSENSLFGKFPTELMLLKSLAQIGMEANLLTGTIPNSVGNLAFLEDFTLLQNDLTGTMPESLFELDRLQSIALSSNKFAGTLPENVGNARMLKSLLLQQCPGLEGPIPNTLTQMNNLEALALSETSLSGTMPSFSNPSLRLLIVYGNKLSGTIPSSLASMPNLEYLSISKNGFQGRIPSFSTASSLTHVFLFDNFLTGNVEEFLSTTPAAGLQEINIANNRLTGTIPSSVGQYTDLTRLKLEENSFNGTLPTELGLLVNMEAMFDVRSNKMTGPIPRELANWTGIEKLSFVDNKFTGTLPKEFGMLSSLKALAVSVNFLTGTVPTEIASLPKLEILFLSENDFTGSLDPFFCNRTSPLVEMSADCGGNTVELQCSCCTICCDTSGTCSEVRS